MQELVFTKTSYRLTVDLRSTEYVPRVGLGRRYFRFRLCNCARRRECLERGGQQEKQFPGGSLITLGVAGAV